MGTLKWEVCSILERDSSGHKSSISRIRTAAHHLLQSPCAGHIKSCRTVTVAPGPARFSVISATLVFISGEVAFQSTMKSRWRLHRSRCVWRECRV
ncbi:hypothetical protein SLEP1_g55298 [Rubroshorea leprosula]|uniref:Uncharacterized protein n=1 Tax=Rubroshorea leprosula TaxID=152421 RepID=A0AAV5MIT1_9ROSI|nr:hypothetical protein SLEP1_g55298 [Rubroshorea leprosula]